MSDKFNKFARFDLGRFFHHGDPNEEPFWFHRLPFDLLTYGDRLSELGYFVVEWLDRHKITEVKYDKYLEKYFLIFFDNESKDVFNKLFEDPGYINSKNMNHRYPRDAALLEYISSAEPGYYLSSGYTVTIPTGSDASVHNYELFCWFRRNTVAPLFLLNSKFFFTNTNDEIQFKLRWM